ncbi:hypothetical protein [Pseudonocardia asaccharolytica]|uniref:ARB-07466-like C-terminal domain-containing protein n=1 Tax=Pseudonocardia asaccharolytica DSM 44247 = NBRC 16224 TaxID=1123024 RepID=A0A511D386_9PSEU|nr:hypothetical protein [Pseudonocardia asaccharolytica]GEL19239.1 hypothetical protein PA7_30760 [Pseudonocardia asaccharolytica DSM 44247 = NBRC 16224]
MSRHRSPGGRRARRGLAPAPVGVSVAARHAALNNSPAANAAMSAALTGGCLALVAPLVTLTGPPDPAADAAVLRLTADGGPAGTPVAARSATDGGLRVVSVISRAADATPTPETADAAGLLKAAGLADLARRAEEERAAREARARCAIELSGLGRVKPWVARAAQFLSCLYDQPDLIGVAGRGRVSDHPRGLAIDLMVRGERGDRIAQCALRNREALGITYVIWKQRINYGDGWQRMENRGNDTENHFDHVHISFGRTAPAAVPDADLCR